IDELPEAFRTVYVMREIEECTVEETASQLAIKPETVKTRLHRARRLLRTSLQGTLAATLSEAFPFQGQRCARMTEAVMARLP
ncbi:MAG TPA: sigma factor-like helix-turn-helix DNA-binding protein, partial [Rhodanobacter sp.]|nr:sigma factor-like helix-turn-helix DNA-binding protein [Rhodanobacter sp.]